MLASRVVGQNSHRGTAETFGKFLKDFFGNLSREVEKGRGSKDKELLEYQEAVSIASAEGPSIKKRINILTTRLASYSTGFSPLLEAYQEAADLTVRSISSQAENLRELIFRINELHSASHGEDLFKPTNKSTLSLQQLSYPCRNERDYKRLIDGLYFLIYEGSGSCKRLPQPPPEFAMDVKFLRTGFRHDVDHGSPAEIKKKKLREADVFKKYSGKKALGECGPEDLLTTQIRLYSGMRKFLESLL